MIFTVKTLKNGKWRITYHEFNIEPEIFFNYNLCIIDINFGIFKRWLFDIKTFDKRIVIW